MSIIATHCQPEEPAQHGTRQVLARVRCEFWESRDLDSDDDCYHATVAAKRVKGGMAYPRRTLCKRPFSRRAYAEMRPTYTAAQLLCPVCKARERAMRGGGLASPKVGTPGIWKATYTQEEARHRAGVYAARKAEGRCPRCGREPEVGLVLCSVCREHDRHRERNRRRERCKAQRVG